MEPDGLVTKTSLALVHQPLEFVERWVSLVVFAAEWKSDYAVSAMRTLIVKTWIRRIRMKQFSNSPKSHQESRGCVTSRRTTQDTKIQVMGVSVYKMLCSLMQPKREKLKYFHLLHYSGSYDHLTFSLSEQSALYCVFLRIFPNTYQSNGAAKLKTKSVPPKREKLKCFHLLNYSGSYDNLIVFFVWTKCFILCVSKNFAARLKTKSVPMPQS